MKIESNMSIGEGDKLHRLDTISCPWRIITYEVSHLMPKYLDIISTSTKKKFKKRIRRDLLVAVGIRYIQEYFVSIDDLLANHNSRAQRQIRRGEGLIESGEEMLERLERIRANGVHIS